MNTHILVKDGINIRFGNLSSLHMNVLTVKVMHFFTINGYFNNTKVLTFREEVLAKCHLSLCFYSIYSYPCINI